MLCIFSILLAPLFPELQTILVRQLAVKHCAYLPPKPLTKSTARLNNAQATFSNRNLFFPGPVGVTRIAQLACGIGLIDLAILLPHSFKKPLRSFRNRVHISLERVLALFLVSAA